MKAIILTIGDEILLGQTLDTNSLWIAQQLNLIGIEIYETISISDDRQHLIDMLNYCRHRADLFIITGGLGPTMDDLTKETLARYFNAELVHNEGIYKDIKEHLQHTGVELLDSNRRQAEVPDKAIGIRNKNGTAPGMWFKEDGKVFVSMPGVPSEMKAMMSDFVLPKIKSSFNLPVIQHVHIHTIGIRESVLAEKLYDIENALPEHISLAYLPELAQVKMRLTGYGKNKDLLDEELEKCKRDIEALIPLYIYSYEKDVTLERAVGELLQMKEKVLATAESCTGGYIAHKITTNPGSSSYFEGGFVTYSNEMKMKELGVKKSTLNRFGAVSKETVREMALGVTKKLGTDYGLSVSGIAGPEGGTKEKPVGTVWMAVSDGNKTVARCYHFNGNRIQNIELSAATGLNMLRKFLKGQLV